MLPIPWGTQIAQIFQLHNSNCILTPTHIASCLDTKVARISMQSSLCLRPVRPRAMPSSPSTRPGFRAPTVRWDSSSTSSPRTRSSLSPLDQSSEPTGRIIFSLNEIYASPEGLTKHWALAPGTGFFDEFVALFTSEGSTVLAMHGAPAIHSLLPKDLSFAGN